MSLLFLIISLFFVALSVLWVYNAINAKSFLFGIVSLMCAILAGIYFYRAVENKPTNWDVKRGKAVYQTETVQKNDSTWVVTFKPIWKEK